MLKVYVSSSETDFFLPEWCLLLIIKAGHFLSFLYMAK
jgi:hypothetical protein